MTQSNSYTTRSFERRPDYPMSFKPANKRIRAVFAGATVVDATRAMVMFEDGRQPVYYFEQGEIRMDLLTRTAHSSH